MTGTLIFQIQQNNHPKHLKKLWIIVLMLIISLTLETPIKPLLKNSQTCIKMNNKDRAQRKVFLTFLKMIFKQHIKINMIWSTKCLEQVNLKLNSHWFKIKTKIITITSLISKQISLSRTKIMVLILILELVHK